MLHSVVRKTRCSDPVVYVEGRRRKVTAVSLTEVSCHKEDVPAKLDKVLVTTTQLHLLWTEISNKEISLCVTVCGWVWLIRLLWRELISHYWTSGSGSGSLCQKSLLNEDGQAVLCRGNGELCNRTTVSSVELWRLFSCLPPTEMTVEIVSRKYWRVEGDDVHLRF